MLYAFTCAVLTRYSREHNVMVTLSCAVACQSSTTPRRG